VNATNRLPRIIQGGMGVGVSNWCLARTVSEAGELGVVSGTGIDTVLIRRLQLGDADGHIRRALSYFPVPTVAQRVKNSWFVPGGKSPDKPFKLNSMPSRQLSPAQNELLILANFVEVFLAKEGHGGLVGINYLEKIQIPTLPSLLGAMLAGVDVVLMGAGMPKAIPAVLDKLSRWEPVELRLSVRGNERGREYTQRLDPKEYISGGPPSLSRPKFLAIVSSDVVATAMARKASGTVDGFVVEHHSAGGHNAPPRGTRTSDAQFSSRDEPDLHKIRNLGLPFWLAGSCASPVKLADARISGAEGIQVGTAFAFCRESGIRPDIKRAVLLDLMRGKLEVHTDFNASPTGYPFKLVRLNTINNNTDASGQRTRCCDLGYLREMYVRGDGKVGYRCPAEPIARYLSKGGCTEEAAGKLCLCNGLMATIGLEQRRGEYTEPPMVTAGEDFSTVRRVLARSVHSQTLEYGACEVLDYLRSGALNTDVLATPEVPRTIPRSAA